MILNLPWYVRFGIDVSAILLPIYVISSKWFYAEYPRGVTHFLTDKRRLQRRRGKDLT